MIEVNKEQIKVWLKQYESMERNAAVVERAEAKCLESAKEKAEVFRLLKICLDELPQEERMLLQRVYIHKQGISRAAREEGYSRRNLYYKMDKILAELGKCLAVFEKFSH